MPSVRANRMDDAFLAIVFRPFSEGDPRYDGLNLYIEEDYAAITLQGTFGGFSRGIPSTGTVTAFSFLNQAGESLSVSGLSIPVATLVPAAQARDFNQLKSLLFGGNDTVQGVSNGNTFYDDVLHGFAGNDTIDPFNGNDLLYGDEGNDIIRGGLGNEQAFGGAGDDLIYGFPGDDRMDGGEGTDVVTFDNVLSAYAGVGANVSLLLQGQPQNTNFGMDTLVGIETLGGTIYSDVLRGDGGSNLLYGLGGGNDQLFGEGGDDQLQVGIVSGRSPGAQVLDGGPGFDRLTFFSAATLTTGVVFSLALQGSAQPIQGGGSIRAINMEGVIGTVAADTLTGDGGPNSLSGQGGADALFGAGGSDQLFGISGTDTLIGGPGADTMTGGTGDDVYGVDDGADVIVEAAGEGFDTAYTGVSYTLPANVEALILYDSGPWQAMGNASGNALIGNSYANVLTGLGGDDVYGVNTPSDLVVEAAGGGYDEVYSSSDYALTDNVETLFLIGTAVSGFGNGGNNALIGNGLANYLDAGPGTYEFLNGAGGDDILVGGAGHDELFGGPGADRFRFTAAGDAFTGGANDGDTLLDFQPGVDKVELNAANFGVAAVQAGVNFFSGAGPAAQSATPTLLYNTTNGLLFYDPDGTGSQGLVVLALVSGAPALTAGDFVTY